MTEGPAPSLWTRATYYLSALCGTSGAEVLVEWVRGGGHRGSGIRFDCMTMSRLSLEAISCRSESICDDDNHLATCGQK